MKTVGFLFHRRDQPQPWGHMPSTQSEPLKREKILIDLTTPSPSPPKSVEPIEIPAVFSQRLPSRKRKSSEQDRTTNTQASSQPTYFVISDESDDEHLQPKPVPFVQPRTPPQPTRAQTLVNEPSPTSTSSTTDAAEVERSLLQHTLIQRSPPASPPVRFLPSDIKLLNAYLCRPISAVMATCSSLILPPLQIPGLPLDRLETLYAKDPWRIKSESLTAPGMSQKVNCWIYGQGWPAKTFIISGWLVGVDRRERFITYHIDDGTAVMECQVNIAQLNKVFDTASQEYSGLPHEKRPHQKSKDPREHQESSDQNANLSSQAPAPKPRSDPRLDPYRRLPSLHPQSHPRSATNPGLETPHLENSVPEAVTEQIISKYAELKIGIVLRLIGQPKSLFRDTKRVLDLEKVIIVQEHQSEEEIRFRQHLKYCRSHIYNQPFRLYNVWPGGAKPLAPGHSQSTKFFPDGATFVMNQQSVEKEKETRMLKLPPVSRLKPQQLTFSNYLNYVSHYIVSRYDHDDLTEATTTNFSYHKLKNRIDRSETILIEDFSIEDLLDDGHKDDRYWKLRSEMSKFTDRLVSQQSQERSESQAPESERNKKQHQSIFLTDHDSHYLSRKKLSTHKAIVTRAIQALVNQGTIIISPTNERRFALPNVSSLGPKIVQIINSLHDPAHPDPTVALISVNSILRNLARDDLWKAVHRETVLAVLRNLQLRQTGPDSWRIH